MRSVRISTPGTVIPCLALILPCVSVNVVRIDPAETLTTCAAARTKRHQLAPVRFLVRFEAKTVPRAQPT
jgi:hypothetical protein